MRGDAIIEVVPRLAGEHAIVRGEPAPDLWAKPFKLVDPATLPYRDHVNGRAYTRQHVSTTVAKPGGGKTSLLAAEATACASGRPLLGVQPAGRLRVWYFNGEDPREESDRQFHALAMHYGLTAADLEGYLFTGSGRDADLVLARQSREGAVIYAPVRDAMVAMIRDLRLDVVILDPFVATHEVPENDNNAIDLVSKEWGRIAGLTNTAIMLAHHPRKADGEITVEHSRGGSALVATARYVRVLNPMSDEDAQRLGVDRPAGYFKAEDGKPSFFARGGPPSWFRMESVNLGNGGPLGLGDDVAVVTSWRPSDPLQGVTAQHLYEVQRRIREGDYRASDQAEGWAGEVVAEVLRVNLAEKVERRKVARVLAAWEAEGLFGREERRDPKDRKKRPFLVVKRWASL